MAHSKTQSPIDEYDAHGVKVIGNYSYVLLVDGTGQCVIQRVSSSQEDIKFVRMPKPANPGFSAAAAAIDAFWASPESHVYKYLFQVA